MKRSIKNLICIILLIVLVIASVFTIKYANNTTKSNNMMVGNSSEMPNGGPGGTPPSGGPGENNNQMTPPTNNQDSNSNDSNNNTPPDKPEDSANNSNNDMNGPQAPGNNNSNTDINILSYILFGIESIGIAGVILYLIMTNFNKYSFGETLKKKDKIIIYILATILLGGILTIGNVLVSNNIKSNVNDKGNMIENSNNNVSSEASGTKVVDGTKETLSNTYESSTSDESAIVVKNGGTATIDGAVINKTGGDSTNTENSEFYGINAGILVTEGSTATIKNSKITTNAKGSNAIFATGENAKIYVSDTTINTTGSSSSRGLDATYGGYIEADNVNITTKGGSCATLATDRGEGTVIAKNSKLETNGAGSPVIYSTGNISISDTTGVANSSQMVVIEGKNSATVTNSTLSASGAGNRNNVDNAGVMIYQSMSGDASEGTGTFTAKNSNLSISSNSNYYKSAPMFFVTNTDAVINLENTKLSYGSNILISAKGTSEWGNSGSNGGNLTLNANNQTLTGNIEVDKISTLTMNLSSSTYKGTINSDNSAKNITLKLDKTSKITLTGNSYVTSIEDDDSSYSNIDFNGYKLYVNGKAIN